MRMLRILLRWAGRLLALVIVLLLAAFGGLQTEFGKSKLTWWLEQKLTKPQGTAKLEGLAGFLPFNQRFDRLSLADEKGIWLEVEQARFSWASVALFTGTLHIEALVAKRIVIHRLPPKDPKKTKAFRLPKSLAHLPSIQLDDFRVDRLQLGPLLLGQAAEFQIQGQVQSLHKNTELQAKLAIISVVPDPRTHLHLEAQMQSHPLALTLKVEAEDGGLLAKLASPTNPLRLQINGSGALQNWQGHWRTEISGLATWQSKLTIRLLDQPEIHLQGQLLSSAAKLPKPLQGMPLDVSVQILQTSPQELQLQNLRVRLPGLEWSGQARLDFLEQTLHSSHTLQWDDLSRWTALAGSALQGSATLHVEVQGPWLAPTLTYQMKGTRLAMAKIMLDDLQAQGQLQILKEAGTTVITAQGKGKIHSFGTIKDPIIWQYALQLPSNKILQITQLYIKNGANSLQGNGTLNLRQSQGLLDWQLRLPALATLFPKAGIQGDVQLQASTKINQNRSITLHVKGSANHLAGLPPPISALLGPSLQLTSDIDFSTQAITLHRLKLQGKAAALSGQATFQPTNQKLTGTWQLALPTLQVLEQSLAKPVQGSATANLQLTGTLSAPQIDLRIEGAQLQQDAYKVDTLALVVKQTGPITSPQGQASIQLQKAQEKITTTLKYRLQNSLLTISEWQLSAPGLSVQGETEVDLTTRLATGKMQAKIKDLGALQTWQLPPLEGQITLQSSWQGQENRQTLQLDVQGRHLAGDFGRIGAVDIHLEAPDLITLRNLQTKTVVQNVRYQQSRLDMVKITTQGNLSKMVLAAELQGHHQQDLALQLEGEWRQETPVQHLYLQALRGHFGELPLALRRPVDFQIEGQTFRWQDLGITFGEASLVSTMDYTTKKLAGNLELKIPLSLLAQFQALPLSGTALARLQLTGALQKPKATAKIELVNLKWQEPTGEPAPALNMVAKAELANGQLQLALQASGLHNQKSTANLTMPVQWSMQPFSLKIPTKSTMQGKLEAYIDLARIAPLLALDGQRVAGVAQATINIKGAVMDPELHGMLTIHQGHYENGFTGSVLQDLEMRLVLANKKLRLEHLQAGDGGKGKIKGSGQLQINTLNKLPFQFELQLDRATLVRQEALKATLSGELTLAGNLEKARLQGTLQTDRVEIEIPERLGPDIAELEIEEKVSIQMPKPGPTTTKTLAMDLRLQMPSKVFVRGRGLDSEWSGDLHIRGTVPKVHIQGTLEAKRGHFDALDRRFILRQGVVDFDGAYPPLPTILVEAGAQGEQILAILRLEGSAGDPQMTLDSEPKLPQDEILARLLFKRDLQSITPTQAAKLLVALNQLRSGKGSSGSILGSVRTSLGLDTLDVGGDSVDSSAIKAGKYLSDQVFMEVQQGLGKGSGKVRVEVEVSPNISLDTELRQDATSGFGVHWKKDY